MLVDVSCGRLTVLAHHGAPDQGTVNLFVAKMDPGNPAPAPDPVLYLGGDSGVAPDYTMLGTQLEALDRELIVLDARGTGHSEPSLVCPDFDAMPKPPVASPVDDPRTRTELLGAIGTCHDRLISQDVDLSAFDLREMAADAEVSGNRAGDRPMERHGASDSVPEFALEYLRSTRPTCELLFLTAPNGREWIRSSKAWKRRGTRSRRS